MSERENLIDFPCSPIWVKHYAERGLIPDYPPDFYYEPPPRVETISNEDTAKRLQEQIDMAMGQLAYFQHQLAAKKAKQNTKLKGIEI